jgi:hypothetical protein
MDPNEIRARGIRKIVIGASIIAICILVTCALLPLYGRY